VVAAVGEAGKEEVAGEMMVAGFDEVEAKEAGVAAGAGAGVWLVIGVA
jgi:hypothetical protein